MTDTARAVVIGGGIMGASLLYHLARAGWTKGRSVDALKAGTKVKLYVGTSRAGGFSGIVMKIENDKGESIVGDRADVKAVDLDGVPGGLQPTGEKKLPGQPGA